MIVDGTNGEQAADRVAPSGGRLPGSNPFAQSDGPGHRVLPIDWLRSLVILWMVLDHAGAFFDAGHLEVDSLPRFNEYVERHPGGHLPRTQFLARVSTHICAPAFIFLCGASLALSLERRRRAGATPGEIDRHVLTRALVLFLLEVTIVSASWQFLARKDGPWFVYFQVLWSIALALLLLPIVRRLTPVWTLAGSAIFLAAYEWLCGLLVTPASPWTDVHWLTGLFLHPAVRVEGKLQIIFLYPALPWACVLFTGFAFGRFLVTAENTRRDATRWLAMVGGLCLFVFFCLRLADVYGNAGLLRTLPGVTDASWIRWLHVSKYPPSATFLAATLGVSCVLLALLFRFEDRILAWTDGSDPLTIYGQVPLFMYVLHVPLLGLIALVSGKLRSGGIGEALIAWFLAVILLYPLARLWHGAKMSRRWPLLAWL